MPEFHQEAHQRGQQSIGVWGTFDPSFRVGALTLTAHTTDVGLLVTQADARGSQQDVLDDAMLARDGSFNAIRDIIIRVPQLIEATLDEDDPLHDDLDDVYAINPNSQASLQERARRVVSLWTRANTARLGHSPPPPLGPLLLGSIGVADLQTLLANHPGLLQTVENERSELSQKSSLLNTTARRVDRNNKRWYLAWSKFFPVGSPENNALSQVDTGPTTPLPSAVEIDTLVASGNNVAVTYVAGGGAHATTIVLLYQIVGTDPDFGHATPVDLDGQTVGPFPPGADIHFKTRASNSTGDTDSAVKSISL